MLNKTAHLRFIIHSENKSTAISIYNETISMFTIIKNSLTELKRYEDDFHYEFSFSVELSAITTSELEHKAFKISTTIVYGPWLFIKLPEEEIDFEFEAIFNHEAFIHHSTEYNNKLKWAHLEIS